MFNVLFFSVCWSGFPVAITLRVKLQCLMYCVSVFAGMGFLSPANRGALMSCVLVRLFVLSPASIITVT